MPKDTFEEHKKRMRAIIGRHMNEQMKPVEMPKLKEHLEMMKQVKMPRMMQ